MISKYNSLAYWTFTGVPTWPKWLGLFIGLLLATLLAYRNLRQHSRGKPVVSLR